MEPQHHPCQHPRKNVQRRPSPDPHTTSRRPDLATGPCPALLARHTAEHFVQRVTDCAQSDLDSSLSAQNVTLRTKRYLVHKTSPHTTPTRTTRNPGCRPARPRRGQLPPTRPGTPTLHRQTPPHPRLNSLKNLRPTPKTRHTTSPPTPPAPQTPPPRTSTVLTSNKYRSHGEGEGRGGRSRASASSRLLLCPGTPGQQPRSLPL